MKDKEKREICKKVAGNKFSKPLRSRYFSGEEDCRGEVYSY